jgi:hypothetical protein
MYGSGDDDDNDRFLPSVRRREGNEEKIETIACDRNAI